MRPPRLRFSMGSLLVLVAVAAVNCWAVPCFFETPVNEMFGRQGTLYRVMPLGVGVLPLVDAAAVGVLVVALRRIRSLRRNVAAADPPSLSPGATFFALNLVLLGSLVVRPQELTQPTESRPIVNAARDRAARAWEAVGGPPGGSLAWILFDCGLIAAVVSGPPLLASWLGGLLARRYAARVPKGRFLATAGLVELGFVAAGLSILLTPGPFVGAMEVPFDVRVVDEGTGEPVRGAFVVVTNDFGLESDLAAHGALDFDDENESGNEDEDTNEEWPPPRAFTDADGRARLVERFVGVGERNAFRTHATVSPWGRWLTISAAGRRTRRIALPEVLGADFDPDDLAAGMVKLGRGEEDLDPFRDCAGTYTNGSWCGNGRIDCTITRDGRFAWGSVVGLGAREYGYARPRGDEIELIPIPHFGSATESMTALRLRAVAWGRQVYLSDASDDALQAFCRQALTPDRPPPEDAPGGLLLFRDSDGDAPPEGLPRVPARVWAKFLARELNPRIKQGSLRLILDALVATAGRKG